MNTGLAEDALRSWQTDKMAVLDSKAMLNATIKATNGGMPGTNTKFDANKVASDIVEMLFAELGDSSGVHVETALATLGALAGFSAQMAIREAFIKTGKVAEDKAFVVVGTKNGETYYMGDLLNEILFENKPGNISVYSLVAGAAQHSGAKELPDIKDIAGYVAGTLGTSAFGVPRLPPQHMPRMPAVELLDKFWNPMRNFLAVSVPSPGLWPLIIGHAAQNVILKAKGIIDPGLAAKIVMETAISLAKIDPVRVHLAYFKSY
jgi:hypothetical protein